MERKRFSGVMLLFIVLAVVLIIMKFTTYLFEVMQTKIDNLNASAVPAT